MSLFGNAKRIIESQFKDRVSVYRYENGKNPDGTTYTNKNPVPISMNIPCKISYLNFDSPNPDEVDTNLVLLNPKIFVSVETDIKMGDYLSIDVLDMSGKIIGTYKGTAGLPNIYVTHKEILFNMKTNA